MKLIGKYNFAKAQNPQRGGSTKLKSSRRLWNSTPQLKKVLNEIMSN
jgi:hypothetical protein